MKGAKAGIVLTGFFQGGAGVNYIHDIDSGEQIIDKILWNEAGHH
jgi:hypothetical protein